MRVCTATFIFPPPEPVVCAGDTPGIVMSISGDLSTGTFWNLNTNTNGNPFANPSLFALEVGDTICVDGGGDVVSFTPCDIDSQFFIDTPATPFTNPFPGCNITAPLAQFLIDTNLINPKVKATVTDLGAGGIMVVVTITDNVNHTIAGLLVTFDGIPVFIFEAPFTCRTLGRKKAALPSQLSIPCPDTIDVTIYSGIIPDTIPYGQCGIYNNPQLISPRVYRYTKMREYGDSKRGSRLS